MVAHAKKSPSGYEGWINCADWESDPSPTKFSEEGTLAHEVGAALLEGNQPPDCGIDMKVDMERYAEWVIGQVDQSAVLHVEVPLDIGWMTGEQNAMGTADVVIVDPQNGFVKIIDLKYGRGLRVFAKDNGQLMMYGAAALRWVERYYELIGEESPITHVFMSIYQPRLDHIDEHMMKVNDVKAWAGALTPAKRVVAGPKQCRWCIKKATCKTLEQSVNRITRTVTEDNVDNVESHILADAFEKLPMVEGWISAVREEGYKRLSAGKQLPGYKLVLGNRGRRKWADEDAVESTLKSMRVKRDLIFDQKLISPTAAESLARKKELGPRQWEAIKALITQDPPKPVIAKDSDKREAITISNTLFKPINED